MEPLSAVIALLGALLVIYVFFSLYVGYIFFFFCFPLHPWFRAQMSLDLIYKSESPFIFYIICILYLFSGGGVFLGGLAVYELRDIF